ncbi:MAG TPA: hypothetical protein PK710_24080, partial [Polyangiaceae bacterium]|nr:hypothetical protein [Polyangiaceae bacterium]
TPHPTVTAKASITARKDPRIRRATVRLRLRRRVQGLDASWEFMAGLNPSTPSRLHPTGSFEINPNPYRGIFIENSR